VLQVRERNVADASHVSEDSIVKLNIAARNGNRLFAEIMDKKRCVMLATTVHYEEIRMQLTADQLF
jgi:hypothetical protein